MQRQRILLYILYIFEHLIHCKSSNFSNIVSDSLERIHIQLYKIHCGDVARCDDPNNHPEPSAFVIPLPCCLPCSCLPTCREHQNCCPSTWNQSQNLFSFNQAGDDSIGRRQSNLSEDFRNEKSEATTRTIINNNPGTESWSVISGSTQVREAFRKVGESADHVPGKETSQGNGNSSQETTRHKSGGIDVNVETLCIRPQVFYKPNNFLDSDAYEMVVSCSPEFQNTSIIEKCHSGMGNTYLSDMVPVTSKHTGLNYLNKYCFMCNELETTDIYSVSDWRIKVVAYGRSFESRFIPEPSYFISDVRSFRYSVRNIHFVPRVESHAQKCKAFDIMYCNQTGWWESYNETIEQICHRGQSMPIIHQVYNKRFLFKNIACVHCNVPSDFSDSELVCGYWEDGSQTLFRYNLTINVNAVDTGGIKIEDYAEDAVVSKPKIGSCPSGYLNLMGRCRRVICPRDYYIRNDECIPLYDVITGLDINVKIGVNPSENVPSSYLPEFLDKLKNILISSITNAITLQYREIAIWHRPISNNNRIRYFLFDIYFFNSSDTIKFGVAVREIENFFGILGFHKSIVLANENKIGLEFEFNHRIKTVFYIYQDTSLETGGRLYPLMGEGWENKDQRAHVTISNINWCFRIAFDEIELVERDIFKIKLAEIVVYYGQYDIETDESGKYRVLYACADLFTDPFDEKPKHPNIKTIFAKADKDSRSNHKDEILPSNGAVVIIVSCLAAFLMVILFCKIKFSSLKQRLPQTPFRSPNNKEGVLGPEGIYAHRIKENLVYRENSLKGESLNSDKRQSDTLPGCEQPACTEMDLVSGQKSEVEVIDLNTGHDSVTWDTHSSGDLGLVNVDYDETVFKISS